MRALVLSDIHGNLQALTAVLAAAGSWDALWNLGDMVGYGPNPNEVLDTIRPLATLTVRGNHDRVCCGMGSTRHFNPTARAAAKWTNEALSAENLQWLRALPQGPLLAAEDDAPVTLAHGSPLNEDQYIHNMRDAWAPLQQIATAITFVGHTHNQVAFAQKGHDWQELRPHFSSPQGEAAWTLPIVPGMRYIVNPGSVGQPRDFDWRASFAIYDSLARTVVYHRVPYDIAETQQRMQQAKLPKRLISRLREGR